MALLVEIREDGKTIVIKNEDGLVISVQDIEARADAEFQKDYVVVTIDAWQSAARHVARLNEFSLKRSSTSIFKLKNG